MKRYLYPFILLALFVLVTLCCLSEARRFEWPVAAAVAGE
jgi:hypothetical protein